MLLSNLNLLASDRGGVARLRELILTLAVQGKLVPQDPKDEPASVLLKKIRAEKDRLIAEGKIKRDKPLAEIAEEEKPFGLSQGWEWVRLAEVAFPQAGFAFKSGGFNEVRQGLPLIRIRDVGESDPSTFFSGDYREEFIVESGDWLVSMDGEFRVREWLGPKALLNQRVTRLMFHGKDVFQPFVTAALQFKLSELQGTKAYTTVDHLSGGQIATSVIALPPLAEQSRIVTRVEELMRLCDALEAKSQLEAAQHAQLVSTLLGTLTDSEAPAQLTENWHRIATHFDLLLDRPDAVDALEQTILQLAVRGLLVPQDPQDEPASELLKKIRAEKDQLFAEGKIKRDKPLPPIAEDEQPFSLPLGWEWVRLGDVSKVISGYAFNSEDFSSESGIRAIKITNAGVGDFYETDDYLPPSFKSGFENFKAVKGDLILALTRPYVSNGLKISQCPSSYDGALINQRVAAIRCYPSVANDFAFAYMQSEDVLSIYQNRFNGSGLQPNLKVSDVTELALPLPPLAEQSRIVARLTDLRRLYSDLRKRLAACQTTQTHLAEALIDEVIAP